MAKSLQAKTTHCQLTGTSALARVRARQRPRPRVAGLVARPCPRGLARTHASALTNARASARARAGSRARAVYKDSDLEHGYYLVHGRVEAACGKTWGGPLL